MKRMFVICFAILVTGCVGDNCFRSNGLGVNSQECAEYRATHSRPADPGVSWFEYAMFPLLAAGAASDVQRDVVSSPHYQAGGSSFRDYTLPQK